MQAMKNRASHNTKPDVCWVDTFQLHFHLPPQAGDYFNKAKSHPSVHRWSLFNPTSLLPCKQAKSSAQLNQNLLEQADYFPTSTPHLPASSLVHCLSQNEISVHKLESPQHQFRIALQAR
jgi:hypothetical protein